MAGQSQERYTHGYDPDRYSIVPSRTAERNAAFFLPHLKPGMSLLDCGCGAGSITLGLAELVAPGEVVGIDFESSQIERAQADAAKQGITNVRFQVANAYELPFPDESFDAVFAHTLLEHLKEPERALEEMKRVMKPGGVIGLRDSDWGGVLIAPSNPVLERLVEIREKVWQHNGGNSRLGRHLAALLRKARFTRIEASASYELLADLGTSQSVGEFFARYFERPDFLRQVEEAGLGDSAAVKEQAKEWRKWGGHSDAFFGYSNCEAIGWKA